MKRQREDSMTSFVDLLFTFVFVFLIFYIILISQEITKKVEQSQQENKAELIISATWDNKYDDDIDLYVEDPLHNIVYFGQPERGLMSLDRDDRGTKSDILETDYGTVEFPYNREIITVRKLVPGIYNINAQMFGRHGQYAGSVPVTIIIEKLNPRNQIICTKTIDLKGIGDEVTACNIEIDIDGNIINVSEIQKDFVRR